METKVTRLWLASFWRAPINNDEIGPQLEQLNIAADTKKKALEACKVEMDRNDWRLVELEEEKK